MIGWYLVEYTVRKDGRGILRERPFDEFIQAPDFFEEMEILDNWMIARVDAIQATHDAISADARFTEVPETLSVDQLARMRMFMVVRGYGVLEVGAVTNSRDALLGVLENVGRSDLMPNIDRTDLVRKSTSRKRSRPVSGLAR
ncbi:hypothetical protein LCGC14_1552800 [marine sediment metagenome]|uniref:Uncharacterized protein n=1 Tax=marine sediment metagenome TaxID=412755 RepID=A0A0F9JAU3_9ZZZZ